MMWIVSQNMFNQFKNVVLFLNILVRVVLSRGNKFILLLRHGVYPYKYMKDWEKFNETSLSGKEDF